MCNSVWVAGLNLKCYMHIKYIHVHVCVHVFGVCIYACMQYIMCMCVLCVCMYMYVCVYTCAYNCSVESQLPFSHFSMLLGFVCKMLENPLHVKHKQLKEQSFQLLGLLVKKYGQTLST